MKLPKHVDYWDDERNADNGIIVTLKSGYKWRYYDHGLHVLGFDTVKEAHTAVVGQTQKCDCALCAAEQ